MVTSTVVFTGARTWGVEMTGELERRWDDAIEGAWVQLRQRVADRLAAMDEDETFLLNVPDDDATLGATPYCQVLAGPGVLRIEAVSNAYLDDSLTLDGAQEARLEEIGFETPSEAHSANFWADLEQREADRAAWMMVEALRQVYGVLHPVYLTAEGEESREDERDSGDVPESDDSPRFPESPEELMAALVEVASDVVGEPVELDEDGDLALPMSKTIVYVTASKAAPRILIFATLLTDVVDEHRALVEVNLLNKAEFGLTFVAAEGRITVRRELPMSVLVPSDVRAELIRLRADVDRWVTDLLARVGGRGWLEDGEVHQPQDRRPTLTRPESDERYDTAMRVLRELENGERGSVDPATMLRIFHGDRDLLLRAVRHSQARAMHWGSRQRKAEQEDKPSYARMCRAQQRYHAELRGRLRRALRLAVQAVPKPDKQEQLELFAEDEASA